MDRKALDRAFNPRCVAVVGDKMANGYVWLRNMSTFTGKLYSVQIDPNEIPGIEQLGVNNCRSLLDIPEPIDYVLVAVPRAVAPRIIRDCIKKGVGGASLFTSGFAETHSDEGATLQETLTKMAREANLNLIGPNCMGIFNPKLGVRQDINQYHGKSGPVGFISQSGTHAIFFSQVGARNGLLISKSVSYGNGAVLDSADYLDYFADDDETKVIGLYIEGVRDGRRFLDSLRVAARRKPVLVWKGGRGEEGYRAISSHTGSLASTPVLWDSLVKQYGAMRIDNLDEMILHMKSMAGNLNAAAKEVRRNPWRLLAKPAEKETRSQNIYDAARAFAEGAGELDDAVSRMNALRDARPEGVKSDDPDLKKVLTRLEGSFEKFRAVEDKLWEELSKP